MAAIYSARLLNGQSTPSSWVSATCPAGVVWVVRSITVAASTAGVSQFAVILNNLGYIFGGLALAVQTCATWEGRHVVNAGEQMEGQVSGGNAFFMVSGYQLTLP